MNEQRSMMNEKSKKKKMHCSALYQRFQLESLRMRNTMIQIEREQNRTIQSTSVKVDFSNKCQLSEMFSHSSNIYSLHCKTMHSRFLLICFCLYQFGAVFPLFSTRCGILFFSLYSNDSLRMLKARQCISIVVK